MDGSEATEACDTLVLAIGEDPDLGFLAESGVAADRRVDVNFAGATALPGVFACGDAAFGHGTVTQALATGRRAADMAHQHLEKRRS